MSTTLLIARRFSWPDAARVRLVIVAGVSYGLLFAILMWQALREQPIVNPDGLTLAALAAWAFATAAAAAVAVRSRAVGTAALVY